jgi:hypothetical protein
VPFLILFLFPLSCVLNSLSNSMIHVVIIVSYLPLSNRAHYSTKQTKPRAENAKAPKAFLPTLTRLKYNCDFLSTYGRLRVCALYLSTFFTNSVQTTTTRRNRWAELSDRRVCVTADISQRESRRDRHDITSFELSYTHTATDQKVTHGRSPFSLFSASHTTALVLLSHF